MNQFKVRGISKYYIPHDLAETIPEIGKLFQLDIAYRLSQAQTDWGSFANLLTNIRFLDAQHVEFLAHTYWLQSFHSRRLSTITCQKHRYDLLVAQVTVKLAISMQEFYRVDQ